MEYFVGIDELKKYARDVTLQNGAKHRCIDATIIYELSEKNHTKLESENERLRSMNQAKLDMINDLMSDIEEFKQKVKTLLKNHIKEYNDSYEDYAWYCANLAEDMYHDLFGVWQWEDENGNKSNSTQIH